MKPVRKIVRAIAKSVGEGAFPGKGDEEIEWKRDPFHVLISTVLSQRTKDENTHVASKRLFSRYDSPEALSKAPVAKIRVLIRPAGFPNAKARAIKEIGRIVQERYGGEVPSDMEDLLALPHVGRKTANCVLVYGFSIDAIPVDTHVHRISNRIGLVSTSGPEDTERELSKAIPRDLWKQLNSTFIAFGKEICRPVRPRCPVCPIKKHCDYYANVFLKTAGRAES